VREEARGPALALATSSTEDFLVADQDYAVLAVLAGVEAAARRWPAASTPDNPSAWLLTTARRRSLRLG
jgi:RNA polymerase sigma-70 factor (ECF subfamily)